MIFMNTARFRFHAELNDFFHSNGQEMERFLTFQPGQTVKHLVESLGVPHTEIRFARRNGEPVPFSYRAQDGDVIDLFPASIPPETGDILLGQPLPGEPLFVVDNHLGRLAAYLRMLGLDALYRNDYQDEELARVAGEQERILLTRDLHLLMRKSVVWGYWVRNLEPSEQLSEVAHRFSLEQYIRPFQRCLRCNTPLQSVSKAEILPRLEPLTRQYFDEFHICPNCGQIYWKGSHFARMEKLVASIKSL
jgi:uncharacterized protein with PIN domain/sulfur carrier protein ThiS